MHDPHTRTTLAPPEHLPASAEPVDAHRLEWTDPVTGVRGFLVVHNLVGGLATGGTRMRAGCTIDEVADLARGMSLKTAAFGLPVGGAKGGIDLDPHDPRATDVLERFCTAMLPWLDEHWVTAEDLGVTQATIDEAFARLGLEQSYHAAIGRSAAPDRALRRVQAGLAARTPDGLLLGEIIGGYGVAQACLAALTAAGTEPTAATVAVQGVGTMGGGAAWYLHLAGARVVAMADAAGTLYRADGLDVPALLDLRDDYGEIDRSRIPDDVLQLDRDVVLDVAADVLVPAAVSYAIRADNADRVAARVVVEAANAGLTPDAEATLTARGIPVVPDFVANAGAAAWAWWLLQGQVGTDPADSFDRLGTEMRAKVGQLLEEWFGSGVPPRRTALGIAAANRTALAEVRMVIP
ncbi:Glu/Leu/Phe/Val dehydrogenase dimerization domain-containing protein [Georgenia sp. Z1491]|uniref:Glu/Leu/Phe/Val dehydrogenase dimerization domain-containing protein n=1 Tax=Georgenia sp. Z1491 TaxID=3416707 RepID=UPI003CF04B22